MRRSGLRLADELALTDWLHQTRESTLRRLWGGRALIESDRFEVLRDYNPCLGSDRSYFVEERLEASDGGFLREGIGDVETVPMCGDDDGRVAEGRRSGRRGGGRRRTCFQVPKAPARGGAPAIRRIPAGGGVRDASRGLSSARRILDERARALLGFADPRDVVMLRKQP